MGLSRGCEDEFVYFSLLSIWGDYHGCYGPLAYDANLVRVSEHLEEAFHLFQDGADPIVIERIA